MKDTIIIFTYGSLLCEKSFQKIYPSAKLLFPAKLYGFVRVFNFPSPYRMSEIDGTACAVLNIEKSEFNQEINGVSFEVNRNDFEDLLVREEGYELVHVDVVDFNDPSRSVRAVTFRALHYDAFDFQMKSKKQQEYVDICLDGCKKYGEEFVNHFLETTFIGKQTMKELNYR